MQYVLCGHKCYLYLYHGSRKNRNKEKETYLQMDTYGSTFKEPIFFLFVILFNRPPVLVTMVI